LTSKLWLMGLRVQLE